MVVLALGLVGCSATPLPTPPETVTYYRLGAPPATYLGAVVQLTPRTQVRWITPAPGSGPGVTIDIVPVGPGVVQILGTPALPERVDLAITWPPDASPRQIEVLQGISPGGQPLPPVGLVLRQIAPPLASQSYQTP